MENAIRARRVNFVPFFLWKSDLGLSWRHLRGIMGRLGKIFGLVLAPRTPSLGPKTPPRWAQDPQENKTKIVVIRVPCSRAAQERPRALQGAPMGYPSWGWFSGHFLLIFGSLWTSISSVFWLDLSKSFPRAVLRWRLLLGKSWPRPARLFPQNAVNFGDFWMTSHKSSAVAGTPRSGALDIYIYIHTHKQVYMFICVQVLSISLLCLSHSLSLYIYL